MLSAATRLGHSHQTLLNLLRDAPDLRTGPALEVILQLLADRRRMDLTDLSATDQAALIASRAVELLPGAEQLTQRLANARDSGRPLVVKFGIDPTAADVHIGHTVPMLLASRFQRMGHKVVFIVGDITARIGDPAGRVSDRPLLTDADVTRNMSSYRTQVSPLFDFEHAGFRFNSEWLATVSLPRLLELLGRLPVSAAMQRDEFRSRLADGHGLTMAELIYSVIMALDSVEIGADVEIGGLDQLLNMQMCRKVMELSGQTPEIVIATSLIEGTDGNGTKMSKSKGNYVGLAFAPKDVYGMVMSAADHLLPAYLRTLTELLDPEIDLLQQMTHDRQIHPMGVKTLLACDITAALHGLDVTHRCRAEFTAQFSRKRFSDLTDIPVVGVAVYGDFTVARLLAIGMRLVAGLKQVRRIADGGGLRLITETPDGQHTIVLTSSDADLTIADVLARHAELMAAPDNRLFLKCGRVLVELC